MSARPDRADSRTEGGSGMGARRWSGPDGIHIDVRGLPPPEPLVAILELVGSIHDDTAVIVHHDRDPRMLYPELAELGWTAEPLDGDPGEVRLRLERNP